MAAVVGMTADDKRLVLNVEWEPAAGVTAAELAATWCRLEVRVAGRAVTAVEDGRSDALRRAVYTSAYPLAEWLAEHWNLLLHHVRPSSVPRAFWSWAHVGTQPWLGAHNLRAVGAGLPWPDLTLVPEGSVTRAVWTAGPGPAEQPVTFLSSGELALPSEMVSDALSRFIEDVVQRLADQGVTGTPLQQEWSLLQTLDRAEADFAAAVARLGLDPFDVSDALTDDVLALADELPSAVLLELLDSVRPDGLREAARWLAAARERDVLRPRPAIIWSEHADVAQGQPAWALGYALAGRYRSRLGFDPHKPFRVEELVGLREVAAPTGGLQGLVRVVDGSEVGLVLPHAEQRSGASRRFAQARALGLSLLTDRELILLDPSYTDLSKASRAFAAELLAPADGLRSYFSSLHDVTGAAFDAVATHYEVSPLLVQYQYENQIATSWV